MRTGEAGTRASKSRLDPRDLIRHWWPILLGLIGTATLAVAPAVPHAHFRVGRTDYAWTSHLVFVGVLCTVFSGIEFGRRQLRLDRLRDEKTTFEANARAGALALARLIFHELDSIRRSAGHYSNERVSLFRSEGDHFVLVGRRSASPVWELTSGRETYPLSEGFLGTAWQDGRAEEGGLPSAGPGRPWDEAWVAAQSAHGIPEHTARSLEMPSRAYLALRIETPLKPLEYSSSRASTACTRQSSRAREPRSTLIGSPISSAKPQRDLLSCSPSQLSLMPQRSASCDLMSPVRPLARPTPRRTRRVDARTGRG